MPDEIEKGTEKAPLSKLAEMNEMNQDFNDVTFEKQVPFDFSEEVPDTAAQVAEEPRKKKTKKVDISKLSIVEERDPITKQRELKNALFGNKSAFLIIAAQSGYAAQVAPLVHKDALNILYSNLSRYEYKKNLYKVIYEKIISFSVGKMTFDEWLKNTSIEDLETFYYGIYCATFPDEGTLTLTCPDCGKSENYRVSNLNLTKTTDRKAMKKLIEEVSKNAISMDAMKQYSLIGKNDAFMLDGSGFIVELKTPSLWDSLELLRLVPEDVIDRSPTNVTNMLYINRILVPKKPGGTIKDSSYVEHADRQELLRIVDNLSIDDAQEIQDAVDERVESHKISYSIKNYKCSNCGKEIKEIPISIEEILFTLIYDKIQ